MRVLIVEDAADLAEAIVSGLGEQGFVVDHVIDAESAGALGDLDHYSVLILDGMLPGLDGLDFCRRLRERGSDLPILMLTARDTIEDRVAGLDAGADDYLVKPFAFLELVARVRALARRRGASKSNLLRVRDVTLDLVTGKVTRNAQEISLSSKERLILIALMRQPGRLLSHADLVARAWSLEAVPSPQVVRAHIKNLRKKLANEGEPGIIETVHGVGYRLVS